jgi:hypothetical protein
MPLPAAHRQALILSGSRIAVGRLPASLPAAIVVGVDHRGTPLNRGREKPTTAGIIDPWRTRNRQNFLDAAAGTEMVPVVPRHRGREPVLTAARGGCHLEAPSHPRRMA